MRKAIKPLVLLLLLATAQGVVRAQYSPAPMPSWYDYGVMRQQTINGWRVRDRMRNYRRRQASQSQRPSAGGTGSTTTTRRGTGGSSPARTTPAAAGGTTFRPVAASVAPQELARSMAQTPAERVKLERMFSDLLANYRDRLRRSGGQANDVARAASYLVAASQMVYFDTDFLSADKYDALREQMQEVLAGDQQFQGLSNREKQKMFESYGIAATWIDAGYRIVKQKGDRQAMEQWREMARKNFESMLGAPPEQVRFTSAGVEYQ